MPLFSIIIPTYNSEKTLAVSLESTFNQTFQDIEVIVVDGCSKDRTVGVIKSFAKRYNNIRWISEKDNGIYDAMNKGIHMASGEWLYFLGSDDSLYDKDVLLKINSAIVSHSTSKFIYGNVMTSSNYVQKYSNYNYQRLLEMCICHQAIFYHRSLFQNSLYNLKYKLAADWDFNLKVFRKKNCPVYIDHTIANYSLAGASSNWSQHPEYLNYFISDKKTTILRYRGFLYLMLYHIKKNFKRIRVELFQ